MAVNTYERVPKVYNPDDIDLVKMTRIWDGMMEGRLNVTGEFTVAPHTTSTTVTDARMRANALVFWVPPSVVSSLTGQVVKESCILIRVH